MENKSNLVINGFEKLVLKEVKVVERNEKSPLIFVEFVDADTYQTSGELMFISDTQKAHDVTPLKLQQVKATLELSIYNNRTSIACKEIRAVK